MMETKKKQSIIKKFQTHAGDTGSSEVQIAILTAEIEELSSHLKSHPKDHSSRRGLLRKVNSRRSLIRFLKRENPTSYESLVKKLKMKPGRVIEKAGAESPVAEDEELEVDVAALAAEEHEIAK